MSMVIKGDGKCTRKEEITLSNGQNVSLGCGNGYDNENGTCNNCTEKYGGKCEV